MKTEIKYIYKVVAKNIKYYREAKGWTVSDLAEATGYSEDFIVKLEDAYYSKKCTIIVVYRIGMELGINPGMLLVERQETESKTEISSK